MIEAIATLITTTFLLLGSPGPAPLALAATGASHGFRNGVPFLAGILAGLAVAIIGAIAGLAKLFASFPELRLTVQILGSTYICYIAFKIATAPIIDSDAGLKTGALSFADGFIWSSPGFRSYRNVQETKYAGIRYSERPRKVAFRNSFEKRRFHLSFGSGH